MGESRTNRVLRWIEAPAVLAVALGAFALVENTTPYIDEYYHVLAARSLVHDGTLFLYDGGEPYTRAKAYTYAVAACYRWFGESWASGRLPSLLCGGLLVMSVFAWLHRTVGRRSAWLGAGLLLLAPHVIGFSSMVRFYTMHMLFVWLAWVCAYGFIGGGLGRVGRAAVLPTGTVCALMAAHVQTTTSIAALAIGVWAGSLFVAYLIHSQSDQSRKALLGLGVLLVVGVPVFILALKLTGAWDHMALKLNTSRPWTAGTRNQFQYYHRFFSDTYPTLWAAFPFIAVIALAHRRRPAWFCLALFGSAFVVHSWMPIKGQRYLSYAWPCFFAVWAIGLDGLLVWAGSGARAVIGEVFSQRTASRRWVGVAIGCFLAGSLVFAFLVTPSLKLGRKMLAGEAQGPLANEDWAAATAVLKPIADATGFVLSSSPPKAIYHLGRLDLGLSVSQAQERPDFAVHDKLNRPIIYSADALRQVMAEHPAGLIVIEAGHFGAGYFVPRETADFIEVNTQPIELPEVVGIKAFRWPVAGVERLSGQAVR